MSRKLTALRIYVEKPQPPSLPRTLPSQKKEKPVVISTIGRRKRTRAIIFPAARLVCGEPSCPWYIVARHCCGRHVSPGRAIWLNAQSLLACRPPSYTFARPCLGQWCPPASAHARIPKALAPHPEYRQHRRVTFCASMNLIYRCYYEPLVDTNP